jgi:hypothetical protein
METVLAAGHIPTVARPKGYPKQPDPIGKRRDDDSDVAYDRALAGYRRKVKTSNKNVAKFNRLRAVQLGISEYKWLAVPGASCDIGTGNDGKIFSYLNPGPDGHPREGRCSRREGCLCVAQSIVPGFS